MMVERYGEPSLRDVPVVGYRCSKRAAFLVTQRWKTNLTPTAIDIVPKLSGNWQVLAHLDIAGDPLAVTGIVVFSVSG